MNYFWILRTAKPVFQNSSLATPENKSVHLIASKAKAAYTGLYAYSNGFGQAC